MFVFLFDFGFVGIEVEVECDSMECGFVCVVYECGVFFFLIYALIIDCGNE